MTLIRLLLFLLMLYLGYRLLRSFGRLLGGAPPRRPPEKTPRGEEMVRDPQCGTFLPRSSALKATAGGRTRYFCSEACRQAFREKS